MNTKPMLFIILLLLSAMNGPALTIDALGSSMGSEVIIQEEDKNDNGLIDVLFVGAELKKM